MNYFFNNSISIVTPRETKQPKYNEPKIFKSVNKVTEENVSEKGMNQEYVHRMPAQKLKNFVYYRYSNDIFSAIEY